MGAFGTFYRVFGRRFSTTLALAAGGVFVLDMVVDRGGNYIWDSNNRGKQWKDIRPRILALQKEAAALEEKTRKEEEEAQAESSENENESGGESPDAPQ